MQTLAKKSLSLVVIMMMISGCESSCNREKKSEETQGEKAALVNGQPIYVADLDAAHKRAIEQFSRSGQAMSEALSKSLRGNLLRKMIDDEILKQRAEKENVKVDRIERIDAFEKYKQKLGGEKSFQFFLARQRLTEEQVMKTVINELLRDKLIDKLGLAIEPSEDEILQYYDANPKLFTQPEMVRARHILLKLAPDDSKSKEEEILKKAQQILADAKTSKESFVSLVQKYSDANEAKNDGDMGFFPRGRLSKNFEDAAFNSPLNTPTGPIKTELGYHVILVTDKVEMKLLALDQMRPNIVETLKRSRRMQKSEELLAQMRKNIPVEIKDAAMTHEEYLRESARGQMNNVKAVTNTVTKNEKHFGDKN